MSNSTLVRAIQQPFMAEGRPQVRTGMEVKIAQRITDGDKSRTQIFQGLVIVTRGKSPLEQTITVRKDVGGIGVEKIFAIHSPSKQTTII